MRIIIILAGLLATSTTVHASNTFLGADCHGPCTKAQVAEIAAYEIHEAFGDDSGAVYELDISEKCSLMKRSPQWDARLQTACNVIHDPEAYLQLRGWQ